MEYNNHKEVKLSEIEFGIHKICNLKYPDLNNSVDRFYRVPLQFEITPEGYAYDITPLSRPTILPKSGYSRTQVLTCSNGKFYEAAVQVVSSFHGWVPFKMNNEYVNHTRMLSIHFSYHKQLFEGSSGGIVLNPNVKPCIMKKSARYEALVEGRYGCDGIAYLLFIVESNGNLTNFEYLGSEGKTNCEIAERHLLELGSWAPARQMNRAVRTQMELAIYV